MQSCKSKILKRAGCGRLMAKPQGVPIASVTSNFGPVYSMYFDVGGRQILIENGATPGTIQYNNTIQNL